MFHFSSSPCFIPVVPCRQFSVTLFFLQSILSIWRTSVPMACLCSCQVFCLHTPFPPSVRDHSISHSLWLQLPDSPWTVWRVSMTLTLHLALHGLRSWVLLSKTCTAGVEMWPEFSMMHRNLDAGIKGGLEKWAFCPCLGNLTWTMTLASLHFPWCFFHFPTHFKSKILFIYLFVSSLSKKHLSNFHGIILKP